jgi:hypothetical protein
MKIKFFRVNLDDEKDIKEKTEKINAFLARKIIEIKLRVFEHKENSHHTVFVFDYEDQLDLEELGEKKFDVEG